MIFIPEPTANYGNSNVPFTHDDLLKIENGLIKTQKIFYATILYKEDSKALLETKWQYITTCDGGQVYEFHSCKSFNISEMDVAVTDGQLRELILLTHHQLQEDYKNVLEDYFFLTPLSEVSDECIHEQVQGLRNTIGI